MSDVNNTRQFIKNQALPDMQATVNTQVTLNPCVVTNRQTILTSHL